MTNNYWLTKKTPLLKDPKGAQVSTITGRVDIPREAIVQIDPTRDGGNAATWRAVVYRSMGVFGATLRGYVPAAVMEPLEAQDAVYIAPEMDGGRWIRQQVNIGGKRKVNQCGPFCAAYMSYLDIKSVYLRMAAQQPALYKLAVIDDRPTGVPEMRRILALCGVETVLHADMFPDDPDGYISPRQAAEKIAEGWPLLSGTNITAGGKIGIEVSRIAHWITVVEISDYRNNVADALCMVYNPWRNCLEYCRWSEIKPQSWGRKAAP